MTDEETLVGIEVAVEEVAVETRATPVESQSSFLFSHQRIIYSSILTVVATSA